MITELSAQNFKSWQDTGKLQFAPLTGFFGANSSGKSSILQVLLLLKQTVERPPEWDELLYFGNEESLVDLKSFDDLIHRPAQGESLDISVSWKFLETMDPLLKRMNLNKEQLDTLSFSLSLNLLHYGIGEFNYQLGENLFGMDLQGNARLDAPSFQQTQFCNAENVESFRCYGFRARASNPARNIANQLSYLQESFEDLFSQIHYLGPVREDPRRDYTWDESHPKDVGWYGEQMISALLSSRIRRHRSIDEQIMKWLRELDLIYSYDLTPLSDIEQNYELLVQQYKDGPEVGLTDVGFGVSQVLPVLTACYYAPEGSTLILEQPDAHLHPKVQSELADVLIDVVENRNIQIILESHSEHLLLRLMRRIAEYGVRDEGISADQTAFYFCEINDGNSKAEQLKVDEYGNISNWPKDFFGDEMGDLAAKTRAEMQRRKANKR